MNKNIDWDNEEDDTDILSDFTCICLVGIEDPVRADVSDIVYFYLSFSKSLTKT